MTTYVRRVISRLRRWLGWDDGTLDFLGVRPVALAQWAARLPEPGVASRRCGFEERIPGVGRICPR